MPAIKKHIVFLLFCALLFSACKEKDCQKDGSCAEDYRRIRLGDSKDYLWADSGSFWIYKNLQTNELDTHIVLSLYYDSVKVRGTYDYSKHIVFEYDVFFKSVWSTYRKEAFNDGTIQYDPNGTPIFDAFVFYREISRGSICFFYTPFSYPKKIGRSISYTTFNGIDSLYSIQGKAYRNIIRFDVEFDDIWYSNQSLVNTSYFWAKDVGLVKFKNNTDNSTWELIESHIVK